MVMIAMEQKKNQHISGTANTNFQKCNQEQLTAVEIIVYAVFIFLWMLYYPGLKVMKASEDHEFALRRSGKLTGSLSLLSDYFQDVSFLPWTIWKQFFMSKWIVLTVANILFGQIFSYLAYEWRYIYFILSSTLLFGGVLGLKFLCLIYAHSLVGFLVSRIQLPALVWLFTVCELVTFCFTASSKLWREYFPHPILVTMCLGSCSFRLLSFGLEYCKQKHQQIEIKEKKTSITFKFADLLTYNLYFPLFMAGPLIPYDEFYKQWKKPQRMFYFQYKSILGQILLCLSVVLFVETATHFFYFHGLSKSSASLKSLDSATVVGIIFWCELLQFLMYFSLYGFFRVVALFDNIHAPKPPACVFSYYTFRDYWRCSDRGIYLMVVKYIYIPIVQIHPSLYTKSLGALCCFMYIALWHGGTKNHLVWAVLCWFGIQLEVFAIVLVETKLMKSLVEKIPAWLERRVSGVLWLPIFMLLLASNLLLITGSSTSSLLYIMLAEGDYLTLIACCVCLYCIIQILIEIGVRQKSQESIRKDKSQLE